MSDPKKDEKKDDKAPAKSKGKLLAIGGAATGLALAFVAATFAIPAKEAPKPELAGPFVGPITPNKVQVNLSDGRTYLVLQLNLLHDAYAPDYLSKRAEDAVCQAEIRDALVTIASAKSRSDVTDKVNKPVFLEEVRHAIEPLVFPVHFGDAADPTSADSISKIAPGDSMLTSQFRGMHAEHVLHVDALQKLATFDGGAEVRFKGDEENLEIPCGDGTSIWIDVTSLEPTFQGDLNVGVMGRTRRVLWNEVLLQ
jgi:flagellar basal body-associated protein FliL